MAPSPHTEPKAAVGRGPAWHGGSRPAPAAPTPSSRQGHRPGDPEHPSKGRIPHLGAPLVRSERNKFPDQIRLRSCCPLHTIPFKCPNAITLGTCLDLASPGLLPPPPWPPHVNKQLSWAPERRGGSARCLLPASLSPSLSLPLGRGHELQHPRALALTPSLKTRRPSGPSQAQSKVPRPRL